MSGVRWLTDREDTWFTGAATNKTENFIEKLPAVIAKNAAG